MGEPRLVLVCGHAACGKTTISLAVAPKLAMNVVGTYGLGGFDRSTMARLAQDREIRYRHLLAIATSYFERGLSVWVEGNFPTRSWRAAILTAARRCNLVELAVVRCDCSDRAALDARFRRRRVDPTQPDATANDISVYDGSVAQFERLDGNEFAGWPRWEVIEYDSCGGAIERWPSTTRLGDEICGHLNPSALSPR
jgi:predicted kinase